MKNNSNNNSQSKTFEAIKNMLQGGNQGIAEELKQINDEAFKQILGKSMSGELKPGQALEMSKIRELQQSEKDKEKDNSRKKANPGFENLMIEQEKMSQMRLKQLENRLAAIKEEVEKLAQATPKLSRELENAAYQDSIEASEYEVYFLEKLFEMIKTFRKRIQNATEWLHIANMRARKKRARKKGNVWAQNYEEYGASYLLSGEHYASRSGA